MNVAGPPWTRLTRLAAEVLKTPMALISLVDRKGGRADT